MSEYRLNEMKGPASWFAEDNNIIKDQLEGWAQ